MNWIQIDVLIIIISEFGKLPPVEPAYQTQKSWEHNPFRKTLRYSRACKSQEQVLSLVVYMQLGIHWRVYAGKLKYYHFNTQTCTEHAPYPLGNLTTMHAFTNCCILPDHPLTPLHS
jgi:hypothetical protein